MGDSGRWCLKCLLLVFNIIYLIFGIAIIAVGGLSLHVIDASVKDIIGNSFTIACVIFLILGILSFLAGLFGCCGALRESRCCLILFSVCIVVLVLVALGIGIIMLAFGSLFAAATDAASDSLVKGLKDYNPDLPSDQRGPWDTLQHGLGCCGINSPYDWKNSTYLPKFSVPDSCCRINTDECGQGAIRGKTVDDDDYFTKGCMDLIEEFVVDKVTIVGGICFGIALLEILGIVIACCLICTIRDSYSV